ncbi:XrtA/PEP-CTERM system histidine kinase PrsK [Magnetospirillum fulvum]|uniref:histidine kinase n=1 Tax=Magnetospirillum fulvum TaxID=1082 RepID=A0A1H6HC68_MAGFU|nr:XrtA/PEP-CTERM system histidine kinase PrsK [Magnetospirillum fulvum]SEH32702.1 putative PEP-CTERM system histidine kinase [Magnetospirillum fulvum]
MDWSVTIGLPIDKIELFGNALCAALFLCIAAAAALSASMGRGRFFLAFGCACTAVSATGTTTHLDFAFALPLETARNWAFLLFFASQVPIERLLPSHLARQISPVLGFPLAIIPAAMVGVLMSFADTTTTLILFNLWQVAVDILILLMLENLLRNTKPAPTRGQRLVMLGIGGLAVFDLMFCVSGLTYGNVPSLFVIARGYILFTLGLPLAFATLLVRGWGSNFQMSRYAVFHSTALVGGGFYLISTSVAGEVLRNQTGNWGLTLEIAFITTATIVLMILIQSASFRAQMMVFISKHFFRLKYDYREVWLAFIRKMAGPDESQNLHERTLRAVAESVACRSGVLWSYQDAIDAFTPVVRWNIEGDLPVIPADDPLMGFIVRTGWIIDIDECLRYPEIYDGLPLPPWFATQRDQWIIVPLIHNRVLEGLIVAGHPPTAPSALGWEDFDLLKTVGAQAAGYLAEERASRALNDARRLAEFNRRFTFVVHDIKNVVSQMSLMLENSHSFGHDPAFQSDMLLTAASSVDRLRGMLAQLGQEGSRRPEPVLQPTFLGSFAAQVVERWRKSYPRLQLIDSAEPVLVDAWREKLSSVMDHLVQNAIDAAGPDGSVSIVIRPGHSDGIIEIVDDGPGMSQDFVRNHLFRPFETRKLNGSGIGAFQALRMMNDMGGRLDVESRPGAGTTMRIRLKCCEVPASPNQEDRNGRRFSA